jgi:hypothetical protein
MAKGVSKNSVLRRSEKRQSANGSIIKDWWATLTRNISNKYFFDAKHLYEP